MTNDDILGKALAKTLLELAVPVPKEYTYTVAPIERKDIPTQGKRPPDWAGIYEDVRTGKHYIISAVLSVHT